MKRLCFASDDLGSVLIAVIMLVLAFLGLAAGARILAYSWSVADRRFLYLSRSQRLFRWPIRCRDQHMRDRADALLSCREAYLRAGRMSNSGSGGFGT